MIQQIKFYPFDETLEALIKMLKEDKELFDDLRKSLIELDEMELQEIGEK